MSEYVEQVMGQPEGSGDEKGKAKVKVAFESTLDREEVVQYFASILDGLRQGTLTFKQGDKSLTVEPADRLNLEVKASRKGREAKVSFEVSWKDREAVDLEISSK